LQQKQRKRAVYRATAPSGVPATLPPLPDAYSPDVHSSSSSTESSTSAAELLSPATRAALPPLPVRPRALPPAVITGGDHSPPSEARLLSSLATPTPSVTSSRLPLSPVHAMPVRCPLPFGDSYETSSASVLSPTAARGRGGRGVGFSRPRNLEPLHGSAQRAAVLSPTAVGIASLATTPSAGVGSYRLVSPTAARPPMVSPTAVSLLPVLTVEGTTVVMPLRKFDWTSVN
jgi:hypothetical protein